MAAVVTCLCVVVGFTGTDGGGGAGRASGFGGDYDGRFTSRPGRGGHRGSVTGSGGRGFDRF